MVQRSKQLGFAFEAADAMRVAGDDVRERFDRDVAVEFRVAGPVDLAHASGTDGPDDFVVTDAGTGRQWHRGAPAGPKSSVIERGWIIGRLAGALPRVL